MEKHNLKNEQIEEVSNSCCYTEFGVKISSLRISFRIPKKSASHKNCNCIKKSKDDFDENISENADHYWTFQAGGGVGPKIEESVVEATRRLLAASTRIPPVPPKCPGSLPSPPPVYLRPPYPSSTVTKNKSISRTSSSSSTASSTRSRSSYL